MSNKSGQSAPKAEKTTKIMQWALGIIMVIGIIFGVLNFMIGDNQESDSDYESDPYGSAPTQQDSPF